MDATFLYESERLYLRLIEPADEARVRVWLNHPENWRTLDRNFPLNGTRHRPCGTGEGEHQERFELLIVLKQGNRPIGVTGLYQMGSSDRSATFGLIIGDREYQSRGFGTEAAKLMVRLGFEQLGLNRIELNVFASNERAIRACNRAGFRLERRWREAYFHTGQYIDVLRYAVVRSESTVMKEPVPRSFAHELLLNARSRAARQYALTSL